MEQQDMNNEQCTMIALVYNSRGEILSIIKE